MKRAAAAVVAAIVALAAASARADTPPNAWELAKKPGLRETWRVHVSVHSDLAEASTAPERVLSPQDPRVAEVLKRLIERLRAFGAAKSDDVRLRYDLATFYAYREQQKLAEEALLGALATGLDHPLAIHALWQLSLVYAKQGKTLQERDTYRLYLEREYDAQDRATATLNLAESEMRLGHLSTAIDLYRAGIDMASVLSNGRTVQSTIIALYWGMAVALDRNSDVGQAREYAKVALGLDPEGLKIAQSPDYFFVPAYERFYYMGLARTQAARASDAPENWLIAERAWTAYVDAAFSDDRWVAHARAHVAECKREHKAALERSAKKK